MCVGPVASRPHPRARGSPAQQFCLRCSRSTWATRRGTLQMPPCCPPDAPPDAPRGLPASLCPGAHPAPAGPAVPVQPQLFQTPSHPPCPAPQPWARPLVCRAWMIDTPPAGHPPPCPAPSKPHSIWRPVPPPQASPTPETSHFPDLSACPLRGWSPGVDVVR